MAPRLKDQLKAKQARQKKVAIGGAVLLVALLAFQGPKTLKMLSPEPEPTTLSGATTPAAPATPAPAGTPASAPASDGADESTAGIADSDPAPDPGVGHLIAFGKFESKDPFQPQVSATPEAADPDDKTAAPAAEQPQGVPVGESPSPALATAPATPTPAAKPPAPTKAVISVNGTEETVEMGKDFPAADPTFRLVSLTAKKAKIGIAGGSFASGDTTITLVLGKPVTLMNTADGTRYELRLISTS
jgi:hypothetical protein